MTTASHSAHVRLMRGGTSRGPVLWADDVPVDPAERDRFLVGLLVGEGDVDGLGGGSPTTSKVAIVQRPSGGETAYQVGNLTATGELDWEGTCGNMTAAVPLFLKEEGTVAAAPDGLRLRNLSTGGVVHAQFIGSDPTTGARVRTTYLEPGGSVTGLLLPTGRPQDALGIPSGRIMVSVLDVTHPYVFVQRAEVESHATQTGRSIEEIAEDVRAAAAVALGAVDDPADAHRVPAVPRIVLLDSRPELLDGAVRFEITAISMGRMIPSVPVTAALCLAAAASVPGSIAYTPATTGVAEVVGASGAIRAEAQVVDGSVSSASVDRTTRTVMEGTACLPS